MLGTVLGSMLVYPGMYRGAYTPGRYTHHGTKEAIPRLYPPREAIPLLYTPREAITWYIPTMGGYNLVYTHHVRLVHPVHTPGRLVHPVHPPREANTPLLVPERLIHHCWSLRGTVLTRVASQGP